MSGVAVLLFTGGCGAGSQAGGSASGRAAASGSAGAAASRPTDPAGELAAAVTALRSGSYRYTIATTSENGTSTATGVLDVPHRLVSVHTEGKSTLLDTLTTGEKRIIGDDVYERVIEVKTLSNSSPVPWETTWVHVDARRVGDPAVPSFADAEPSVSITQRPVLARVERDGARAYRGVLDLAKATPDFGYNPDTQQRTYDLHAVPFTATVDDRGRLTGLEYTLPKGDIAPERTYRYGYSDHGLPVAVEPPPAGEVRERPEWPYK